MRHKHGLSKWSGTARKRGALDFPYTCYQHQGWDADGNIYQDRIYCCPWYEGHNFTSLDLLRSFVDAGGKSNEEEA